jgi:dephospho-CoA kinase
MNKPKSPKVLIIGHARHGKDTAAEYLTHQYGLSFANSSLMAAELFIFDALKEKYGYQTLAQCYEDRVNHRGEWFDMITEYNKEDAARLAGDILKTSDMYVGMRSEREISACYQRGLFDITLAIFDPRKPLEDSSSLDFDPLTWADAVIYNSSGIEEMHSKLKNLFDFLLCRKVWS